MARSFLGGTNAVSYTHLYVTYFRDIAMNQIVPGIQEQLICLGMALSTFIIGFAVFKATEKKFILYV